MTNQFYQLIVAYFFGCLYQLFPEYLKPVEIKDLLVRAGEYLFSEKLISKGIGIIDAAIIFASIQSNSLLWTLDKKIKKFLPSEYLFVLPS